MASLIRGMLIYLHDQQIEMKSQTKRLQYHIMLNYLINFFPLNFYSSNVPLFFSTTTKNQKDIHAGLRYSTTSMVPHSIEVQGLGMHPFRSCPVDKNLDTLDWKPGPRPMPQLKFILYEVKIEWENHTISPSWLRGIDIICSSAQFDYVFNENLAFC